MCASSCHVMTAACFCRDRRVTRWRWRKTLDDEREIILRGVLEAFERQGAIACEPCERQRL